MQGAKSLRERFPIFPLEYMLTVLNDVDKPAAFRADMARAAAPYIHPRLVAVEISEKNKPQTKQSIDVTKLTDDELAFLERLIMKSQTTTVIDNDPQDAPMIEYDDRGYRNVF